MIELSDHVAKKLLKMIEEDAPKEEIRAMLREGIMAAAAFAGEPPTEGQMDVIVDSVMFFGKLSREDQMKMTQYQAALAQFQSLLGALAEGYAEEAVVRQFAATVLAKSPQDAQVGDWELARVTLQFVKDTAEMLPVYRKEGGYS